MGARCNFIFKDSSNTSVTLYSHWGEYTRNKDLAMALKHAMPRIQMNDIPYATRMAISWLIQDSLLDETGFGIFSYNPNDNLDLDYPILVDFTDNTITDETGTHSLESFVNYHSEEVTQNA